MNISLSKLNKSVRLYNVLLRLAEKSGEKVTLFDYDFYVVNKLDGKQDGWNIRHHGIVNNIENELTPSQNFFNSSQEAYNTLYSIIAKWTINLAIKLNQKEVEVSTSEGTGIKKILTDGELDSIRNEYE